MSDVAALQRSVLAAGVRLLEEGLAVGTWGNLSARVGDRIVITPSGADRRTLAPSDLPVVDLATGRWTGPKPSAERTLHLAIYRAQPDAGAIIHAHSPNACTLAAARRGLAPEPAVPDGPLAAGVRCAPHALTGTKALERGALDALRGRRAALLANHGAVCTGRDLDDAFRCVLALEAACRALVDAEFARVTRHLGALPPAALREVFLRWHARL